MEKNELQRFRSECLAAHNFFRATHGTPPLGWSSRLADSAQSWAEQLAICGPVRNSSEKDHGENVASLWGSELTGQKVTRIWYEEARHFNYDKPRFTSRTRSFCQVIWEGSREFGVGAAVTKHGKKIVVARYFPPANKKDVAKNVKKARTTQTHEDEPIRSYDTRWSRLYLGLKQFHEECLEAHNDYRLRHGAAPVRWSASLAWEAQQWAEELARKGELQHNDDDTVGENLAGMLGGELSGREVVDMWYDEIENYDFDDPRYDEDTSNFTQVVWVASESLGVGRAVEGDLCVAVAFYEPPGNMEGMFGENVLRMGSTVVVRKTRQTKGFVPPPPDLDNFRIECLVTHNYYRARHGSPPLVLNSTLTDEAQYWAERLLVTGASEDFDNSHIGICVAVLDKKNVSGIKVSEQWYKEILNYDFDSPGFGSQTRDFSQLVWFSSRKFGVGKASSDEGVTVVVARYEPVGNIDGLFVQNVKRRGHERGSCEPMIFHVDLRYRVRTDSKSSNSFLSWENEGTQTFGEVEKDVTKTSDLELFDENENIVHRTENWENQLALPANDHFTRLVWIDPQSPILQRKGITKQETAEEGEEKADDIKEVTEECNSEKSWDEEDAKRVEEQENRDLPMDDLTLVIEESSIYAKEAELENAIVYSDPEDDISEHIYETRHSLSLDSEGFEQEMQKGHVLSKVAFFETFQQSFAGRSPSSSGSSYRRSFIHDEPPELSPLPERNAAPYEEEERECQLEYEDVFPAHREEDEEDVEVEGDENVYENEGEEDEEESLVSVSDTEDTLDFMDYSDKIGECQTQSQELKEEGPSDLKICDNDDDDVLRQYPDVPEVEKKPVSITKHVILPVNRGTTTESQNVEAFSLCKDDRPDLIEKAPFNYSEEYLKTSEAEVQIPFCASQKTLDSDCLCIAITQEDFDTRLNELRCRAGLLSPVEDNEEDLQSFDLLDFNGTNEGKLLLDIYNNGLVREMKNEQSPIEEVCDKAFKDEVLTEIDIEELFAKLDRDEKQQNVEEELSEIEGRASTEDIQVTRRDPMFERSVVMDKTIGQAGFVFVDEPDRAERKDVHCEMGIDSMVGPLIETEEATSENLEEETTVSEKTLSSPSNIANEGRNSDLSQEIYAIEQIGEEKRASLFSEEETFLEEAKFQRPSSPGHITDERVNSDVVEEGEIFQPIENEKRVSLFLEENTLVGETVLERSSSPRYVTNEAKNSDSTEEIEFVEQIQEQKRASLFAEEDSFLQEKVLERSFSPRQIASETEYRDRVEEREEVEEVREEKRASWFLEEEPFVEETTLKGPSSPRHLASETENSYQQEETEDIELIEGTTLEILNVDTTADKAVVERSSSPRHIANEGENSDHLEHIKDIEAIVGDERAFEMFEEATYMENVLLERPQSPMHLASESVNCEPDDENAKIDGDEEEKSASLFLEEDTFVGEVILERSSPTDISNEGENSDHAEEINEVEQVEEEKRASLILEEEKLVDKTTLIGPSSPRHLASEAENSCHQERIIDIELIEEAETALEILNVDTTADKTTLEGPSSPKHGAGDVSNIEHVKETAVMEEAGILEIAQEFEDAEDEVNCTHFSYENQSSGNHVAGDLSTSILLEVSEEHGFPELDCGQEFVEFESLSHADSFQEASQLTHVAGEVTESGIGNVVHEDVIHLEECLECEDDQDYVTTTNTLQMDQTALYVAGEVLNVEPQQESSEEEKPGEEGFAEELEDIEIETTTVAFKSPRSLLRMATAALERNIDTTQQDLDETSKILVDEAEQYSEGHVIYVSTSELENSPSSYSSVAGESEVTSEYIETSETEIATEQAPEATTAAKGCDLSRDVPVIVIKTAGEVPMNGGDEICLYQETIQEHKKEEPDEMYHDEKQSSILELSEGLISQSHGAGAITSVEFDEQEVTRETGTAEQIDESESSSLSENTSEHPLQLHTSSDLKDVKDFVTSNGEAHTQAHSAITNEPSDSVSEEQVMERLPSFYVTEKCTPIGGYMENAKEEPAGEKESAQVYNNEKQGSRTEIPLMVLQPPLQMAAELPDSDFGEGVEVEHSSDGEISEECVVMEELVKQGAILERISDPISTGAEVVSSDPHIVKEEEEEVLDETDSAQEYNELENPVAIECHSVVQSSMFVAGDIEHPDHQEHRIQEETQLVESANQHEEPKEVSVVEYTAEIYCSPASQGQELTEQYSTEIESNNEESSSTVYVTGSPDECHGVEAGEKGEHQICEVADVKGPVFENVPVTSTSHASSEVEHRATVVQKEHTFFEIDPSDAEKQQTEAKSFNRIHHDDKSTVGEKEVEFEKSHAFGEILTTQTVKELSPTSLHTATEIASYESQYKTRKANGVVVHYIEMSSEVDRIHEVHVKSFPVDGDLSEGILEKEMEDQEEERLAKELSIEEIEVRLMKSEISEHKTEQDVIPLVRKSASEERETTMKDLRAKSLPTEDSAGAQQSRDYNAVDILKEDEASLEDESAVEQTEKLIEIMRLDEALSEEEFRGEAVETTRRHSTDSEPDDSNGEHKTDTETNASGRSDSVFEEEIEIREVQPIYEEEFEMERVHEEKRAKPFVSKVGESVYEEEIEVVAVPASNEPDQEHLEEKEEEQEEHRLQSPLWEKKVEVTPAHTGVDVLRQEHQSKTDGLTVSSSVFEEELDIGTCEVSNDDEETNKENETFVTDESEIERAISEGDKEPEVSSVSETVEDTGPEEGTHSVQKKTGIHKLQDGEQLELYEEEGTVRTRYYVEVSSSESLEPTSEVTEDEPSYPETYVRQGDPLEENLEEFILVRYGDEFESSGEEEVGDLREIYVIPEEDNDVDEHSSRGGHTLEELEGVKERDRKSLYEQGYETVGLEEIRESPEFDMEDSPDEELDEEEQRQLEEYERLESFVILEEKLSQVESDEGGDEDLADLQADEGDENVFHSDVCSSSEETLHAEELGETMTDSILRDAVVAGKDVAQERKLSSDDDGHEQQTKTLRQSEDLSLKVVSQKSEKREVEISEEEGHLREVMPEGDPFQVLDEDNNEMQFPTSLEEDNEIHQSDDDNNIASAERYSEELVEREDTLNDKDLTQVIKKTEDKADHSPSSDSSGEQSVSSGGSLSSTPSVDLEGLDEFQQDCLLQHNIYRRQHRARPLVWSDELAVDAKEWAEHLARENSLEHTEVKGVGENLASEQGKELSGSEVVEMWYREATDYDFEVPAFNAKCGNFTNVVWASSRKFGVAKSVSNDGTHYVVARYKPMGNVVGEFKENVKPPREASSRLKRRRSSARRRARSSVPPFTPSEREKFMNECVISHNYYRTFHGAPALRWSPLLAAEAQNYAERLAKTDSVTHSGQKDRGENLAYSWDAPLSAPQAIDMWYDEVQQYDFNCPGFTSETAHFTQLVWVGTEDFGMGMAVASDGRTIVVGRYFPPGNIVGQFQENVRPREIGIL